jgi:hypothetical protein
MQTDRTRPAAWTLIAGAALASAGYLAASLLPGDEPARLTHPLWVPLNALAITGDILMVLGLPAILVGLRGRALALVGYVGLFAALVMLNISEGVIEAFVKPYLVGHGGVPDQAPPGFAAYEGVALFFLLVGLLALGVAVLRSGTYPRWVGVAFLLSPVSSFLPVTGPLQLLSDYLAYAAIIGVAVHLLRTPERERAVTPVA